MMFAWDLDPDTHSYFREYLDVFINKRKISKDLREWCINTGSRAISAHIRQSHDEKNKINMLRISLHYRVGLPVQYRRAAPWRPILIDKIHPPEYYHDARKLSAPSRPHTNP